MLKSMKKEKCPYCKRSRFVGRVSQETMGACWIHLEQIAKEAERLKSEIAYSNMMMKRSQMAYSARFRKALLGW